MIRPKRISIWQNKRIRQVIILVSLTFVILWMVLGFLFYKYSIDKYENYTLMRLAGIANSLALQIDGDEHQSLIQNYGSIDAITFSGQDTVYDHINTILAENFEANMLKSPLYTLVKDGDNEVFYFGVTSQKNAYFRHPYLSYHPTLSSDFARGGIINPYKDEFGMWLSAFAPIKNKEGKTVAVVMVDEKFDIFIEATKNQMWKAFIISLIIFASMLVGLFYLMKNILLREIKDKIIIEKSNDEKQKINAELSDANEKLNHLDAFRKEMISNISHDLRTPLSSIIGFLELVKDSNKPLEEETKNKYLSIAYSESRRLNTLVKDLFELSKLESGHVILNQEEFNIYELVHDILNKYELRINAKHIKMDFEINEDIGLAYGDIKYIDRVFQNLLDNAVKYTLEGGYIKIWILDDGDFFKIKICNSGERLSKDELPKLFERYYIGKEGKNVGSGLGLAISKKICELHGCTIEADANDDIASFWFTVHKNKNFTPS